MMCWMLDGSIADTFLVEVKMIFFFFFFSFFFGGGVNSESQLM